MGSQFRTVAIAPGHAARVRRSPNPATRLGYVLVVKTRGRPFEIPGDRWDNGNPA